MQHKIERDARVMARDGEVGRVSHVVVDPDTREVTEMVVDQDGREWLIPMSDVQSADGQRIILRVSRSEIRGADEFRRDEFHAIDDEQADRETQRRAAHGGAPLLDAEDNAVVIGDVGETETVGRTVVEHSLPVAPAVERTRRVEPVVERDRTVETVRERVVEPPRRSPEGEVVERQTIVVREPVVEDERRRAVEPSRDDVRVERRDIKD